MQLLDNGISVVKNHAVIEVNFDRLVGPTHHFGGHAYGNSASMKHKGILSSPKEAALQGLEKMWLLTTLGIPQGVFPPDLRPRVETLRALGFFGSDEEVIGKAAKSAPKLLESCSSSASMWMANSATVIPSSDSSDKRVHFFIANLGSSLHRNIEAPTTEELFRHVFKERSLFTIHSPLPVLDEGAANHTRLFAKEKALHLFTYGVPGETLFPARQSKEAGEAIVRFTGIKRALFLKQTKRAIEAGVFHSDVISTGNGALFLYHQEAFEEELHLPEEFQTVQIDSITLEEAVKSYFFNSQLITVEGKMLLLTPDECNDFPKVKKLIESLVKDPAVPIKKSLSVPLNQSMQGGGGPACLRLRVPLTEKEMQAIDSRWLLTEKLYKELKSWIAAHYRERLTLEELQDPALFHEAKEAQKALRDILPFTFS